LYCIIILGKSIKFCSLTKKFKGFSTKKRL
jgi:hypothetical protein